MIAQLLVGSALVVATVAFHVVGLTLLSLALRRFAAHPLGQGPHALSPFLLGAATLGVLAIHTAEAWGWAVVYLALGEFATMADALYFSVVTATTLGYGDLVLGERWRLLSTFEAMGGLILFAASAAYLLDVFRRIRQRDGPED